MRKLVVSSLNAIARVVRAHWLSLMLMAWIVGAIAAVILINPLPRDERLIEHLHRHRADITEIVRRFRSFEPKPERPHDLYLWAEQGDTPELMRRTELWTVNSGGVRWYPDPYSQESAREMDRLTKTPRGLVYGQRYGTIYIRVRDPAYWRPLLRYALRDGFKDLVYIPEPPRIEGGWLIAPPDHRGRTRPWMRVLDSLTAFPPEWKKGECVLRQIEPQWFIRMCNV